MDAVLELLLNDDIIGELTEYSSTGHLTGRVLYTNFKITTL